MTNNSKINHSKTCKCCEGNKSKAKQPALDTLAQLGIFDAQNVFQRPIKFQPLKEDGIKTLKKRANRKYIAANMAKGLILINDCDREIRLDQLRKEFLNSPVEYTNGKRQRRKQIANYTTTPAQHEDVKTDVLSDIKTEKDALFYILDVFVTTTPAPPAPQKTQFNDFAPKIAALHSEKRTTAIINAESSKKIANVQQERKIFAPMGAKTEKQQRLEQIGVKDERLLKPAPLETLHRDFAPVETLGPEQRILDIFYKTSYNENSNSFTSAEQQQHKTLDYFTEEGKDKKIIQSYWNMYHCNRSLIQLQDGTVTTNYCKNRLCVVCNAVRTAELTNLYKPVLDAWRDEMYMVTLTVENCSAKDLKATIHEMQSVFVKIKDTLKKKFKKGELEKKFEGLRKFECTSIKQDSYHPHFHILVRGRENAHELRKQWVKIIKKSDVIYCQMKGKDKNGNLVYLQNVTKAKESVAAELFKYFTKILSNSKKDDNIYLNRLDTIFKAIRGKRVFQTFGFKIKDYSEPKEAKKAEQQQDLEELFNFSLEDNTQSKVDDIHLRFAHIIYKNNDSKIIEDTRAAKNFVTELYNVQKEYIQVFELYLDNHTKENLSLLFNVFESCKQSRTNLKLFQKELKLIHKNFVINLECSEELNQKIKRPQQHYLYNDNTGTWDNLENGKPFFKVKISEKSKRAVERLRCSRQYAQKIGIVKTYLDERIY